MSDKIATRDAYGKALAEFGAKYDFVVLDADLAALHKAGIDPEVRRRGRRPVALSLYLEKQQKLAELEAKRDEAQALADQLERARS